MFRKVFANRLLMVLPAFFPVLSPVLSAVAFLPLVFSDRALADGDAALAPGRNLLSRHYQEDDRLTYHMKASNRGQSRTIGYEAQADGVVKKDSSGNFVEEFRWSHLTTDGRPFPLSPESELFRQTLSLAPNYKLTVPNLSQVQPMLIGPITDLLTFYADLSLAMSQSGLSKPGDHVYFIHGTPNSWADGTYVVAGEDSIDFDITLKDVDAGKRIASVVVRHVPPAEPQIKLPAEWMRKPIADTPNNWMEVSRTGDGKYAAEVGKETFEVELKVDIASGKIVSATLDNPVSVMKRECKDAGLTDCGEPVNYRILRKVAIG